MLSLDLISVFLEFSSFFSPIFFILRQGFIYLFTVSFCISNTMCVGEPFFPIAENVGNTHRFL